MAKNEIKIAIVGDAKSATKALSQTAEATQGLQKQLAGFAQAAAGAMGAQKVIGFAKQSIKAFGDLGEAVNKSRELFGTASISVEKFSEGAAKNLGQSRVAALEAATTMAVFGKSAGKTGQELATFSTEMVTLASDLASFHNTRPEEAVYALGAALRGEYEPARRFGYQLSVIEIGNKAVEMGLADSAKSMDMQAKTLAAQALLMEQAGDAVGDFARTSDSATNAQRILAAQMEEVKVGLGAALMPAFEAALGIIMPMIDAFNGLDPVIKNIIGSFAVLTAGLLTMTVALAGFKAALGAVGISAALASPAFLGIAAAVTAVAVAYGVWTGKSQAAEKIADSLAMAIRQTTEELAAEKGLLDELIAELEGADAASATLFQTFKNDGVRNSENLIDAMGTLGITYEDLFTGISGGEGTLEKYIQGIAEVNGATEESAAWIAKWAVANDDISGILSVSTGATYDFIDANKGVVRAIGEVVDAEDWYADLAEGSFRREFERGELLEESNKKIWEQAAAIVQMGNVTGEATTWMDVYNEYINQMGISTAAQAELEARLASRMDDTGDSAMSEAEAIAVMNAEIQAATDAYTASIDAANAWAQGVRDAVNSGSQSFVDTGEVADQSAQQFIDAMNSQTVAAHEWEQDLATVQSSMTSGTETQKADFIAYLAEMGAAGAPMVDDLSKNTDLIQPMFDAWVMQTAVTKDGMIGALDPVAAGMEEKVHAADLAMRRMLATARGNARKAALAIGEAIPDGMETGIARGQGTLNAAVVAAVDSAVAAAKEAAGISSPSTLFRDEVGAPIVEGIEEGIITEGDRINKAITSAIESATKDAVAAAETLVKEANDALSQAWGSVDEVRTFESLKERVSDSSRSLTDAQARVAEARAELANKYDSSGKLKTADDRAKDERALADALEAESDSSRSLEDAYLALTKATIDQSVGTAAMRKEWEDTARAAGLSEWQIRNLISAYTDLQDAQGKAREQEATTSALAARAQVVASDFAYAVRQGWVQEDVLKHIAGLDPGLQMDAMIQRLNMLQAFFGGPVKQYAKGTRFHPGGLAIVGEAGPELVQMPRGSQVFSNRESFGGGSPVNITIHAGLGADGIQLGRQITDILDRYQRAGGRR